MATKKQPETNLMDFIQKQAGEFEKKHPVLAVRYYVYEHTPATEDDYGSYVSERNNMVSGYMDNIDECKEWMEKYDPEPGTTFKIGSQKLRRYVEERWGR